MQKELGISAGGSMKTDSQTVLHPRPGRSTLHETGQNDCVDSFEAKWNGQAGAKFVSQVGFRRSFGDFDPPGRSRSTADRLIGGDSSVISDVRNLERKKVLDVREQFFEERADEVNTFYSCNQRGDREGEAAVRGGRKKGGIAEGRRTEAEKTIEAKERKEMEWESERKDRGVVVPADDEVALLLSLNTTRGS
ncbi:hypothetical protein KM043_017989 [Ampulex compressa]|nr:hypothetical protein KM043_017989 [Ampulex compressa]